MVAIIEKRKRASRLSEEKTKQLMSWIEAGKRHQQQFFDDLEVWREKLKGKSPNEKWTTAATRKDPGIVVNLAYSHVRTLVPTVFAQSPYINLKAPQEYYLPRVPAAQAAVNMVLPRARFKHEGKKAVLDAAVLREGWIKWMWIPHDTEPQVTMPQRASTSLESELDLLLSGLSGSTGLKRNEGAQLLRKLSPDLGSNPPTWPKRGGPVCVRVPPTSIVVDPLVATRDPLLARFVAVRYMRPLSELRADSAYTIPPDAQIDQGAMLGGNRNAPRWRIRDAIETLGGQSGNSMGYLPDGVQIATIWEVWAQDLVDVGLYRQMTTLMEGVSTPIREPVAWEEFIGDHGGYPLKRLTFNDVPDSWPMNELEGWDDLAQSISWMTSKALTNVKRFARIYYANTNKLRSDKEAEKLKDGKDGTVVFTTEDNAVGPIQTPTNSSDTYAMIQMLMSVVQNISGISDNRRGEAATRTATEAKIIEGGSQVRSDEKADVVNDFIIDNVECLLGMMKKFVTKESVAPDDRAAQTQFHRFGPETFDFEPGIEVRPDSTRFANEQRELAKWQAVMTIALQLVQLGLPIRVDIIAAKLFTALGVDQVPEIMGRIQVNPEGEQLVEAIQMMAGIPTPVEPGDAHPMHLETMMKIEAAPFWPTLLQHAQAVDVNTGQPSNMLFLDMWNTHKADHQAAIEEMAAGAAANQNRLSSSPIDQANVPANQARGERPEPEEAQAVPGASNQMVT